MYSQRKKIAYSDSWVVPFRTANRLIGEQKTTAAGTKYVTITFHDYWELEWDGSNGGSQTGN